MTSGSSTRSQHLERRDAALDLEAVAPFVARHVAPPAGTEAVPLLAAAGRVLAGDVVAPMDLPPFDQSAVDGYGLPAHLLASIGRGLPVAGMARAGDPCPTAMEGVVRLLTGAPVPAAVAAVAMQEHVDRADGTIRIGDPVRHGANIRRRGEDVARGDVVLTAGTTLDARHVALLAALGLGTVDVRRTMRAAILACGDELAAAGAPRGPTAIHDANSPMAAAFLARRGVEVVAMERIPDRLDAARDALARHAGRVDLVVTSGGMSSGDTDHTRGAVEACGGRWVSMGILMKPGKPSSFALIDGTVVVGLPGNPFAALVAMVVVGLPVLAALDGSDRAARPLPAVAAFDLERRPGRAEFFPARRVGGASGVLAVDRLGKGGSARLRPVVDADGLGLIDAKAAGISRGDPVGFLPFETLL